MKGLNRGSCWTSLSALPCLGGEEDHGPKTLDQQHFKAALIPPPAQVTNTLPVQRVCAGGPNLRHEVSI